MSMLRSRRVTRVVASLYEPAWARRAYNIHIRPGTRASCLQTHPHHSSCLTRTRSSGIHIASLGGTSMIRFGCEYETKLKIGQGAYGTVYLVQNVITNEEFALKRIIMQQNDEGVPQSVLREIAALTALKRFDHPNIIKLHEAFILQTENGGMSLNIVFDKCDWDLYDFLNKIERDMEEPQIKCIARQIFKGVDFLHFNSIIHRDLKPQNILINRDLRVKISDYGLARNYGLHATFTTVVVTLWYRSPELLLQCKYNTSIDIWSVGCIFAELYNLRPLFPAQTEAEQLKSIFEKLGTPLKSEWPVDAIVEHAFYALCEAQPLSTLVPRMSDSGRQLLASTLRFPAHMRPTAALCLASSYFSAPQK